MTRAGTTHGRAAAAVLAPLSTLLLIVLTGCTDDQTSTTPAPPPASGSADPEPAPVPAEEGVDDSRFGASLERTGEVLLDTFEHATAFTVDGTTLTLVLDDGSAGFDGSIDCLSANGVLQDGETLVLQYPDGTTEC